MARKKTPKVRLSVKASLSRRLREVRQEVFGEHGGPELARRLSLPARTWYNYETGVTVPAEVLLGFIEQTGVNPMWLLNGEGPRFRQTVDEGRLARLTPVELIRRGLEELERNNSDSMASSSQSVLEESGEFVDVPLYPLSRIGESGLDPTSAEGRVLAYRHWLPHPNVTIGTRLVDDAMHPILPSGSVVAIDRSVTDPLALHGQIVAVQPSGTPMIRWLEVSGRHVILRPNQGAGRDYPLIPLELDDQQNVIIGQVVWSWSRFHKT